jgi:hypothetical protein
MIRLRRRKSAEGGDVAEQARRRPPAEGRLETVADGYAIGWAWNPSRPQRPVEVEVVVDGETVAEALAHVKRPDIARAGIGDGRHGFAVPLPEFLTSAPSHEIHVVAGRRKRRLTADESFSTTVRSSDGAWSGTTFVPTGSPAPFVPKVEAPPDPGEGALVGRRGWLFLRDDDNLTLDQLRGRPALSRKGLEAHREALLARRDRLRQLGVPYLFAVAPMKERVNGGLLPEGASLHPVSPVSRLNRVLRDSSAEEALYLLPALVDAREHGRIYHRTDTNWNHRGAFFAYRALMKEIAKRLPSLEPLPVDGAAFVTDFRFRGDLADKPKFSLAGDEFVPFTEDREWEEEADEIDASKLKAKRMPAPKHLEVTGDRAPHFYERPDHEDLPRAILLGDSCCLNLIPWLAEHFRRFTFLWTSELPFEAIELELPDIVIHVISERYLASVPPKPAASEPAKSADESAVGESEPAAGTSP